MRQLYLTHTISQDVPRLEYFQSNRSKFSIFCDRGEFSVSVESRSLEIQVPQIKREGSVNQDLAIPGQSNQTGGLSNIRSR